MKVDPVSYGPSHWPEASEPGRRNERGPATFVAGLFERRNTYRLPYRKIAAEVEAASSLRRQSVRGMLATNPVIRTHRDPSGDLTAYFQPDCEAALDRARDVRRRSGTLVAALSRIVERPLRERPDRSMPAFLRLRVLAEVPTSKGTLYSYVDRMPNEERLSAPGSRGIVARLKDAESGG